MNEKVKYFIKNDKNIVLQVNKEIFDYVCLIEQENQQLKEKLKQLEENRDKTIELNF